MTEGPSPSRMSSAAASHPVEGVILEAVEVLERVARARGDEVALGELQAASERLAGGGFRLAVLGAFKRGKSTLLNALLGDALLPMGALPVTSVITEVQRGPKLRILVSFRDKPDAETSREQLASLVTQAENPDNEKGVRVVRVEHPSLRLPEAGVLVDTPGVGSTFASNTETTRQFMSRVDAALFVVATDPPISSEEVAFLHQIREQASKVLVVLNKADRFAADELAQIEAFTRARVSAATGEPARVFVLSAKDALDETRTGAKPPALAGLESEVVELVRRLRRPLQLQAALRATQRACASLHPQVVAQGRALVASDAELATMAAKARELRAMREQRERDLTHVWEGRIDDLRESILSSMTRFVQEATPRVLTRMREVIARLEPSVDLRERARALVRDEIAGEVESWYAAEEERLASEVRLVEGESRRRSREIATCDLAALGFGPEAVHDEDDAPAVRVLPRERRFYFIWQEDVRATSGMLSSMKSDATEAARRLLRVQTSPEAVLREYDSVVPFDVDVNAARAKDDLVERSDATLRELREAALARVRAASEQLSRAIEEATLLRARRGEALRTALARHEQERENVEHASALLSAAATELERA